MLLTILELEHFRGIGEISVSLEPTTVLLGENRTGKTTVVDAIELALGASRSAEECPFLPTDLSRGVEPPPDVRITLTFTETEDGEWKGTPLEPRAIPTEWGRRNVRLRLTGRADPQGNMSSSWSFLNRQGAELPADLERVRYLRERSPCLILAANRYYVAAGSSADSPPPAVTADASREDLERTVEGVYRRACQTRGMLSLTEIESGLSAARRLDALGNNNNNHPSDENAPLPDVRDMVESPRDLAPLPAQEDERLPSAQNLALLLLVGSLLEASGDLRLPDGAFPLVVIEEPEAHLHPILASSLWGTIKGFPAQKVITTNSGDLLAAAPIHSLRRLTRRDEVTTVHQLEDDEGLTIEDLRRVGYHVRVQRGISLFARAWLLVEGETEAWLLPGLARQCGYVLANEGVACLEFAQCGLQSLVKMANALGIEWHVLVDGDEAGTYYAEAARESLGGRPERERITALKHRDVEHTLWHYAYHWVFKEVAPGDGRARRSRGRKRRSGQRPHKVIQRAIRKHSKPYLALRVLEAAVEPGSPGAPAPLERAIECAVWLARSSVGIPAPRPKTLLSLGEAKKPERDR